MLDELTNYNQPIWCVPPPQINPTVNSRSVYEVGGFYYLFPSIPLLVQLRYNHGNQRLCNARLCIMGGF